MAGKRDIDLDTIVTVLKATGEPTRLRLLALLSTGELSVKDLTQILKQSQPRVSRHLKLLVDAGIVLRNAEGAWAHFSLASSGPATPLVESILRQFDTEDAQRLADLQALSEVRNAQASRAATYFAKVAPEWDRVRGLHVAESEVEAAILDLVGSKPVDTMLDLGTGTGRMLELLAPRYRRGLGIDTSREMLAVARAKLSAAGIPHASVRLGDILSIDSLPGDCNLVVLHQVLHYFDDPGRVFLVVRQVLAPGGMVLVVDFAPHALEFLRDDHAHRRLGISSEQVSAWAEAVELKVQASIQVGPPAQEDALTVRIWQLVERSQFRGRQHDYCGHGSDQPSASRETTTPPVLI